MEPKTTQSSESVVREIKRKTRPKLNPEEKTRTIIEGLKGEARRRRWDADYQEVAAEDPNASR